MDLTAEKVIYGIQALMMFLQISKSARSLKSEVAEKFKERCLQLIDIAANEPLKAAELLNQMIEQMNQSLLAPYPSLMTDSMENLVKGEVVAFEHYLNQELKAHNLTVQQEAPLFNDSLVLWEKIGVDLSPDEGVTELSELIKKLNILLPLEDQYPFPEKE